ncbi:DUF4956 domain-containing protein [Microbacterium sp. NPDC076911]|uniref:DUF4956 domain-containing protein n=1 Tax=Microbacterium sp. NPDC076911 TaxID=3154958 RepID=UPI00342769BD
MSQLIVIAIDLLAIGLLAFAVYYPRHRRRDLAVAFVGINVGVLAVAMVLGSSTISAGLGLGLFGVLSIIRLRSREIEQSEIAYYFAALAIGLIAGISGSITWLSALLIALVVIVISIVDSPQLLRRSQERSLTLDRAYLDDAELQTAVEELLGCEKATVTVRSIDLVSDTTSVNVRYNAPRAPRQATPSAPAAPAAPATSPSATITSATGTLQVQR